MLNFPCVACGHRFSISEAFAGCDLQCPQCRATITAPGGDSLKTEVLPGRVDSRSDSRSDSRTLPIPPALPVLDETEVNLPAALAVLDETEVRPNDEPMVAIPGLIEGASAAQALPVRLFADEPDKEPRRDPPHPPTSASPKQTGPRPAWDSAGAHSEPVSGKTVEEKPADTLPAALPVPPTWMESSATWGDAPRPLPRPPRLPRELLLEEPDHPETSGKALGAMVFGLATFIVPVVCAIPAFILGTLALRDIRRRHGLLEGRGTALTGIILALVGNLSLIPLWLVKKQLDYSSNERQVREKMAQIADAILMFERDKNRFPQARPRNDKGQPTLSWRVHILPYLGENELYKEFHLDEPWDSPHNSRLIERMPPVFASSSRYDGDSTTRTRFQVFTGPDTLFPDDSKTTRRDVLDPEASTFLLVEAREPVPWTKPDDLAYQRDRDLPKLGASSTEGFYAATVDGAVRFIDNRIDMPSLHRAVQPRDGSGVVRLEIGGGAEKMPLRLPGDGFDLPPDVKMAPPPGFEKVMPGMPGMGVEKPGAPFGDVKDLPFLPPPDPRFMPIERLEKRKIEERLKRW